VVRFPETTPKGNTMNALQWFLQLDERCNFQTKEGNLVGKASKSEIRRWFQNGAIQVNGVRLKFDDQVDVENIQSIVLFPKNNKARVTLW